MKGATHRLLLLSAITLLSHPSVYPQHTGPAPPGEKRRDWELNIAYYLGGSHTSASDLMISQPSLGNSIRLRGVNFEGRSFDRPLYYGARVGFFPRRSFPIGAEVEFIHLKVYTDPVQSTVLTGRRNGEVIRQGVRLGEVVQQYSVSHGVNLLLFNAVARRMFNRSEKHRNGRLIFAARVGVGPTIPHTESTIDGRHQEQYEVGALAIQLAGGAELHLWRGLYLISEYKLTRTRQRGRVFSGRAEALLRSHQGVVGLSYHF